MAECADAGVFQTFGSLGSIGADVFLWKALKVELRETGVGWEQSTFDRAFQADLPLVVALLSHSSELEAVESGNPSC